MSDDSPRLSVREIQTISARIATILGENDTEPLTQIRGLLRRLGDGFVLETLEEAQQIEREGGMLVPDGSRSRTLGGIFFYLVKGKLLRNRRYADLAAVFSAFAANRQRDGAALSQRLRSAW